MPPCPFESKAAPVRHVRMGLFPAERLLEERGDLLGEVALEGGAVEAGRQRLRVAVLRLGPLEAGGGERKQRQARADKQHSDHRENLLRRGDQKRRGEAQRRYPLARHGCRGSAGPMGLAAPVQRPRGKCAIRQFCATSITMGSVSMLGRSVPARPSAVRRAIWLQALAVRSRSRPRALSQPSRALRRRKLPTVPG